MIVKSTSADEAARLTKRPRRTSRLVLAAAGAFLEIAQIARELTRRIKLKRTPTSSRDRCRARQASPVLPEHAASSASSATAFREPVVDEAV
jgi:hypothetical protein